MSHSVLVHLQQLTKPPKNSTQQECNKALFSSAALVAANSFASSLRGSRTRGIPVLGSGRIFPVSENIIAIEQRAFPTHWPRIGGMDFGWDHPFAAVELFWDRDTDTVYVSKLIACEKQRRSFTPARCELGALRWAWPRDGKRKTLEGAGIALAEQYRAQGLNLLHEHAQYDSGSVSRHLNDWWEEFRLYHRKDGRVVKEGDDLMSATRYAIMILSHASTKAAYDKFRAPIRYRKAGF